MNKVNLSFSNGEAGPGIDPLLTVARSNWVPHSSQLLSRPAIFRSTATERPPNELTDAEAAGGRHAAAYDLVVRLSSPLRRW